MDAHRLMRAAEAYAARGWFVFVVSAGKVPYANCNRCAPGAHSGAACPYACLTCHGHLAATRDEGRLRAMIWGRMTAGCHLALDCGRSGLVVVDAEGDDRGGHGFAGTDVIDQWEAWTGGRSLPVTGLRATTGSGGLHLFYESGPHAIHSVNRVLPNVDIKAGGGYVVAPPAEGRAWSPGFAGQPGVWDEGALPPVVTGTGGTSRNGAGASLRDRVVDGMVPGGARYEYTRDLVYKLRKNGVGRAEAEEIMRREWERYAQPPAAAYEMPWHKVAYELDRAWARVEPDRLSPGRQMWVDAIGKGGRA